MKYFWIHSPNTTQADGRYTWKLPALRCSLCNRYKSSGFGIASLDITGHNYEKSYREARSVFQSEYDELTVPIKKLLPDGQIIRPGMGFGKFQGTVGRCEKRDFLWVLDSVLLLKKSTYSRLSEVGIQIDTGPAEMKTLRPRQIHTDYSDIVEVVTVKCMAIKTLEFAETKMCPQCGLKIITRPKQFFLEKNFAPQDKPIFAIEGINSLFANEKFVNAVKALKLNNIICSSVELV